MRLYHAAPSSENLYLFLQVLFLAVGCGLAIYILYSQATIMNTAMNRAYPYALALVVTTTIVSLMFAYLKVIMIPKQQLEEIYLASVEAKCLKALAHLPSVVIIFETFTKQVFEELEEQYITYINELRGVLDIIVMGEEGTEGAKAQFIRAFHDLDEANAQFDILLRRMDQQSFKIEPSEYDRIEVLISSDNLQDEKIRKEALHIHMTFFILNLMWELFRKFPSDSLSLDTRRQAQLHSFQPKIQPTALLSSFGTFLHSDEVHPGLEEYNIIKEDVNIGKSKYFISNFVINLQKGLFVSFFSGLLQLDFADSAYGNTYVGVIFGLSFSLLGVTLLESLNPFENYVNDRLKLSHKIMKIRDQLQNKMDSNNQFEVDAQTAYIKAVLNQNWSQFSPRLKREVDEMATYVQRSANLQKGLLDFEALDSPTLQQCGIQEQEINIITRLFSVSPFAGFSVLGQSKDPGCLWSCIPKV